MQCKLHCNINLIRSVTGREVLSDRRSDPCTVLYVLDVNMNGIE